MQIKRNNQRRNLVFALLQGTFMRINLAFVDSATVLSAFVDRLTGSNILVGLTGSMMTAGWMWPQLLVSNLLEHRQRKMPFYAIGMGIRVLAWFSIFLCTISIGVQNPFLLAGCFLGFYFLSSSAMGVSTLPYMDIISKSIAPNRRARFFSLRQVFGGIFSIGVGLLVRAMLGNEAEFTGFFGWLALSLKTLTLYFISSICQIETELGFPSNYAFLFICSVITAFLSFISFLGIREPIHPVNASRQPMWDHLKQGPHFLKTDKNYRRFIYFRIGMHFASMASHFYVPYAIRQLGVAEATIGFFIVCSALSGVVSNAIWGYIGEKYGVRWLLIISAGLMSFPPIIAFFSAMLPPALYVSAYLLIFAISGILSSGVMVGFMSYMLNIAPPRSRPSYIGFMNTLLLPTSFAPFIGGFLVSLVGFRMLFVICFVICLVAFAIGTGLQEIMYEDELEEEGS